jgi:hypothetical protein
MYTERFWPDRLALGCPRGKYRYRQSLHGTAHSMYEYWILGWRHPTALCCVLGTTRVRSVADQRRGRYEGKELQGTYASRRCSRGWEERFMFLSNDQEEGSKNEL